jgi:hypothetical protein
MQLAVFLKKTANSIDHHLISAGSTGSIVAGLLDVRYVRRIGEHLLNYRAAEMNHF